MGVFISVEHHTVGAQDLPSQVVIAKMF